LTRVGGAQDKSAPFTGIGQGASMSLLQRTPMTLRGLLDHNLVHLRDMALVELLSYVAFAALLFAVIMHIARLPFPFRLVRVPQARPLQVHREVFNSTRAVLLYNVVQLAARVFVLAFGYIFLINRPLPAWEFWLSLPLVIVVHDAYFYWTHRFMHLPGTFRWMHWEHHRSQAPTVFTAYSFSIPEAIVQGLFGVFYIAFFPGNFTTLIFFYTVEIAHTVAIHSGFEFGPRSWVLGRFGWLCGATHHDLHHRTGRNGFGLYFRFWDRLMKTEHPDFERIFDYVTSPQNDGAAYKLLSRRDAGEVTAKGLVASEPTG
jgi:sterol desaturase/sphingolipid hydroxylase (fatty acid hydroxylase superfamily)